MTQEYRLTQLPSHWVSYVLALERLAGTIDGIIDTALTYGRPVSTLQLSKALDTVTSLDAWVARSCLDVWVVRSSPPMEPYNGQEAPTD